MNDIKLFTKIYRDRDTLQEYNRVSVVHSVFFDGPWTHDKDEFIVYEDRFTEKEWFKLTKNE